MTTTHEIGTASTHASRTRISTRSGVPHTKQAPKMGNQVQRKRLINASIAATWAAISEMRAVEDWHPNVARASVLTDHSTGVGASRRVEFQDGNSVVETVIEESKLHFTTMEMSELPLLRKAVVTIRIAEQSAQATEVTFSIDYDIKFGPIGWLLDQVMMKRVFGKIFGVALEGLCYHLETGELVADSVPVRAAD